jgi:uncharacterized protein YcfL
MQIEMKNILMGMSHVCAAVLIILGLSACRTVNMAEPAVPTVPRQMVNDQRITTDRSLDFSARIVGINQAVVGSGDLLKIQVELENNSRTRRHFNYKFEWFDQNAMLIQAPAAVWIPKEIEARETIDISAVAPNPQAKDFRLKIIEK